MSKRSVMIAVQCFYSVDLPDDMEFANDEEAQNWALKQFVKNDLVDTVESNDGDQPFRKENCRTLDGRVTGFDNIQPEGIIVNNEIEQVLKAISKGI